MDGAVCESRSEIAMNRRFEPIPLRILKPTAVGTIAFTGAMVVDLLPLVILAFSYNAIARVVSR